MSDSETPSTPTKKRSLLKESLIAAMTAVGFTVLIIAILCIVLAKVLWLTDILTSFRIHYVVTLFICGLGLLLLGKQKTALALVAGALVIGFPVLPYLKTPFSKETPPTLQDDHKIYRLMTYNVLKDNDRYRDVADFVAGSSADFVLFIEVNKRWADEMDFELRDHYPHRFVKPQQDYTGLAFYSKHPWKSADLVQNLPKPAVRVVLDLAEGLLELYGVHPSPPMNATWAKSRNTYLKMLGQRIGKVTNPNVIVAGDLNCTPWSPYFSEFLSDSKLRDSGRGRGIQNTWYRYPVLPAGLPIDHVLTGPAIGVHGRRIGPPIGSDHRPITVDFTLQVLRK